MSGWSPKLEPFAGDELREAFEAEGITVVLGVTAVRPSAPPPTPR